MPRKRRQNTEASREEEKFCIKKSRSTPTSSGRSKEENFNRKKCVNWFHQYSCSDERDLIGPEGMETFCKDIQVNPEDITMLIIAWKMNAKRMGYFTLQEWLHGLSELQCDSLPKLQNKLGYLRSFIDDLIAFKSIFRYSYDFAKDMDQRNLDVETAKTMLHLLLDDRWILLSQFCNFLGQSRYKVINKDQWCNILEFSKCVTPDLTNYDTDGAWPVLLDEFVEWIETGQSAVIT